MLDLNAIRTEFAAFLARDPTRWRMDAALAHVVTVAYQQGLADERLAHAAGKTPPPCGCRLGECESKTDHRCRMTEERGHQ